LGTTPLHARGTWGEGDESGHLLVNDYKGFSVIQVKIQSIK